jgi:aminopeptidase N
VLVNDDDLTYAKIRLDERRCETLTAHVGDFAESLPGPCAGRGVGHDRDAEMPARDYLATVLAGIGRRATSGVVSRCCVRAQAALTAVRRPGVAPTRAARSSPLRRTRRCSAPSPAATCSWRWVRAPRPR